MYKYKLYPWSLILFLFFFQLKMGILCFSSYVRDFFSSIFVTKAVVVSIQV